MSVRSRPAKASMAAPPVSPEVAPTMVARCPRSASTWSISRASNCMATSLKASVGPWNSSRMKRFGPDLDKRADRLVAKRRIGFARDAGKHRRVDLAAEERRQHADRQLGIGQAAHGTDLGCRELTATGAANRGRRRAPGPPAAHPRSRERAPRPACSHIASSPVRAAARRFGGEPPKNRIAPVAFLPRGCYRRRLCEWEVR